jgi:predicted nucleic-acid-binding Zn-ribbon protein
MPKEKKCPKCGSKMKDGQILVDVQLDQSTPLPMPSRFSSSSMLDLLDHGTSRVNVEGPIWCEETEKEEGLIIKRKRKKKLPLKGSRCLECGYVELFVKLK